MEAQCLVHLRKILELTEQMMQTADSLESEYDDSTTLVICGVVRDRAYEIRRYMGELPRARRQVA